MLEILSQPWHWSISGIGIVVVMFLLLWFGGEFGTSANLRTFCAISGAGNKHTFFAFDWKKQMWNLIFIFSAIIGGYIAINFLASPEPVQISNSTQLHLESIGICTPSSINEGFGFVPAEIYSIESILDPKNLFLLISGGFFVGFGARYAGGCTSGHAISGLSNLQLPSFIAVIGFFIGGLIMTWLVLPIILTL